jgi:hypothetical protein
MRIGKKIIKFAVKFVNKYRDKIKQFKEFNKTNFVKIIALFNSILKKMGLSLRPTQKLYDSMKKTKINKDNLMYLFINMIENVNKLNNKIFIERTTEKIKIFLNSIKIDPTFVSLDLLFLSEPNEQNYNALVIYFKRKDEELKNFLNLGPLYPVSLNIMDDDLLPMYSSIGDNDNYSRYKEGKISYASRDVYSTLIKSSQIGEDVEKTVKGESICYSTKLGLFFNILLKFLMSGKANGRVVENLEVQNYRYAAPEVAKGSTIVDYILFSIFLIIVILIILLIIYFFMAIYYYYNYGTALSPQEFFSNIFSIF